MSRMSVLTAPLVTAIMLLGAATSHAQLVDTSSVLQPPTLVNGVLTVGGVTYTPDEYASREELPGLGRKFELLGTMIKDIDPENAEGHSGNSGGGAGGNEVISAFTTPGALAFAWRQLGNIRITALTNQINLKYYFVAPKNCVAGGTRVVLFIDSDGDGDWDFSSNGHINPAGGFAGCEQNKWVIEDLTDDLPRWEVTPGLTIPGLPTYPYAPWKLYAAAVMEAFPNHQVLAGFLLDGESCSPAPLAPGCGKAYFDLFTLENRTLEIWHDAVKK